MLKKIKVVILATNEKSSLWSNIKYNLYFLSDEEIKDVIDTLKEDKRIYMHTKNSGFHSSWSKIIAITDKFLRIESRYVDKEGRQHYDNSPFPEPSEGFIQKYIEEYNKGNIITDVMVEYGQRFGLLLSISRKIKNKLKRQYYNY